MGDNQPERVLTRSRAHSAKSATNDSPSQRTPPKVSTSKKTRDKYKSGGKAKGGSDINRKQGSLTMSSKEEIQPSSMDGKLTAPPLSNPPTENELKWMELCSSLNQNLAAIRSDLTELKGIKGKVENFSDSWKNEVDQNLAHYGNETENNTFKVNLLTNIIIKQEERINILERRLTAMHHKELKPNLIIKGLIEKEDENKSSRLEIVKDFFKEVMEIEQDIEVLDAFRVGKGKVKPMLVKLKDPSDKAIIFSHVSNLKEKTNARKKLFFVQDDEAEDQQNNRLLYRELLKEEKDKPDESDQLVVRMVRGDKVSVNNTIVGPRVQVPEVANILHMSGDELAAIKTVKLCSITTHCEQGSEFHVFATKVKMHEEVLNAYTKSRSRELTHHMWCVHTG